MPGSFSIYSGLRVTGWRFPNVITNDKGVDGSPLGALGGQLGLVEELHINVN